MDYTESEEGRCEMKRHEEEQRMSAQFAREAGDEAYHRVFEVLDSLAHINGKQAGAIAKAAQDVVEQGAFKALTN